MTCAGYWMEDLRSMMITYDPDDPISQNFRCWVYRRIDYKNYLMSRSTRARCGVNQTASSYSPYDGASVLLSLTDNERECKSLSLLSLLSLSLASPVTELNA